MKKQRDIKHTILLVLNALTLVVLVVFALVFVTPFYKNVIGRDAAVAGYRQCQLDTANVVVNDLNTKGFTQLTVGDQKIQLVPQP